MSDIFILAPDPNGTCCDCSSRNSPCDNCGSILECRTKGSDSSSAFFCGIQEFTHSLVPSEWYRTQTVSGEVWCCAFFSGPDCTGTLASAISHRMVVYGDLKIDGTNCSEIEDTIAADYYHITSCGGNGTYYLTSDPFPCSDNTGDKVITPTTSFEVYSGDCVSDSLRSIGTYGSTLSDQDTQEDAINRFLASTAWGDWSIQNNCSCRYQIPTGVSFQYSVSQYRLNRAGYAPNTAYDLSVNIYRRVFGSGGAYTLYQTIITPEMSDGSGFILSDPIDVPNDMGYETYADGASATVTPV